MNSIVTEQQGKGFYICQIKNSDLAIFSYYVESEKQCFIIDPMFDTKIYDQIIKKRGSTLKYVVMTHYHADFVSGQLEFKVPIIMGQGAKKSINKYQIKELKDGEKLEVGTISITSMHTPGHTLQCTTYLFKDSENKNICIFTGDTLFLGEVGRPDLSTQQGVTKIDLAGMLFESIQKIKQLEDEIRIYPGHGSGSSCGGDGIQQGNYCTLGRQKQRNKSLKIEVKNLFISSVLQQLTQAPAYYQFTSKLNQQGPPSHDETLNKAHKALSIQQFQKLKQHCRLFQTRPNIGEEGTIKKCYWTFNKGPIPTLIAIVADPEDDILVIVEEGKSEETVQRFIRMGYFNVKGYNGFKISDYPGQKQFFKVVNGKQALAIQGRSHLDVRSENEWKKTGVIEGAYRIPIKKVSKKCHQVQHCKNLVVNCKTGGRARLAQSILANYNIESIALADKVQQLEKMGHKMVPYFKPKEQ